MKMSWDYIAGFFDAAGCIHQQICNEVDVCINNHKLKELES